MIDSVGGSAIEFLFITMISDIFSNNISNYKSRQKVRAKVRENGLIADRVFNLDLFLINF